MVRGPGLRGGTKGQVRQSAGEKLAFARQLSGIVRVGMWAGGSRGVGYCRCLWVRLIGYERDSTTQRGRFRVVPCVPVCMRTGGAQLSGHTLESGVGHC